MNTNFSNNFKKNIVIDVRDVCKSFKQVKAVDDVSMKIHRGEFVALLGPNGAGKTTLVEMIEGIQKPDAGQILIKNREWTGNEKVLHQIIGLSLQETRFIDKLTVIETLRLFASFYDLTSDRVEEIIELAGLEEKRKSYVGNLSGGQKQRLALGIALLNKPEILLLDEPTTGLDPTARRDIWNILMLLKEERATSMILTTHYMEEAEFLCDYIILIDHGRIIREGDLDKLLNGESHNKTVEFILQGNLQNIDFSQIDVPLDISWDENNSRGKLKLENIEKELPKFLEFINRKNLILQSLECRKTTLNDLFLSLTGRRLHE
ncbi:MAG: ABC transporter ATP-binding protein [Calditrichaeota bacterium]|nr:ABC transporter ATP-binding protein [Calditrichota bacterium]RQW03986.1 MAG: ABC transporter ATP-binding protein [Calditrichota bacterium]